MENIEKERHASWLENFYDLIVDIGNRDVISIWKLVSRMVVWKKLKDTSRS